MFACSTRFYKFNYIANYKGIQDICEQILNDRRQDPFKNSEPRDKKLVEDIFTCSICHQTVVEPRSCSSCNKLNCAKCLEEIQKRNPGSSVSCPNCRSPHKLDKLNILLKDQLSQSLFFCKFCQKDFKYTEMLTHRIVCEYETKKCPSEGCKKVNFQSI